MVTIVLSFILDSYHNDKVLNHFNLLLKIIAQERVYNRMTQFVKLIPEYLLYYFKVFFRNKNNKIISI